MSVKPKVTKTTHLYEEQGNESRVDEDEMNESQMDQKRRNATKTDETPMNDRQKGKDRPSTQNKQCGDIIVIEQERLRVEKQRLEIEQSRLDVEQQRLKLEQINLILRYPDNAENFLNLSGEISLRPVYPSVPPHNDDVTGARSNIVSDNNMDYTVL